MFCLDHDATTWRRSPSPRVSAERTLLRACDVAERIDAAINSRRWRSSFAGSLIDASALYAQACDIIINHGGAGGVALVLMSWHTSASARDKQQRLVASWRTGGNVPAFRSSASWARVIRSAFCSRGIRKIIGDSRWRAVFMGADGRDGDISLNDNAIFSGVYCSGQLYRRRR